MSVKPSSRDSQRAPEKASARTSKPHAPDGRPKPVPDGKPTTAQSARLPGNTTRRATNEQPAASASAKALIFGYRFRDSTLLELALTHRSLAYEEGSQAGATPDESSPQSDNEQLEFLGDAVLGLVVAQSLFERFSDSREGELTRLRASIVSRKHLGEMASRLKLGERLRLGKGEERSGGRRKPALLSNALEAVIAAMYLDGGLDVVGRFIEREIVMPALPVLHAALEQQTGASNSLNGAVGDHKSALQERLQASGYVRPQYVLIDQSGPDHQKLFSIEVRVVNALGQETALGRATGPTKKEAQQQAARLAMVRMDAASESEPDARPGSEFVEVGAASPQSPDLSAALRPADVASNRDHNG